MTNHFLLVGDKKTWETAFKKKTWGFSTKTKGLWKGVEKGDLIAFYVTRPVKGVIGFGKIKTKSENSEIYWPDEILFEKKLWPYEISINIIVKRKEWKEKIQIPSNIMVNQGRKKISKQIFLELVKIAEEKWSLSFNKKLK